jgi:hypothetical protein
MHSSGISLKEMTPRTTPERACKLWNRSKSLRRRVSSSGKVVLLLALAGLATRAWSQQNPARSPHLLTDAALPDAPDVQGSAAQPPIERALPGSIQGVVVDRDGTVCEGARIALVQSSSAPPMLRTATSDSSGRFDFYGVPAGAFKLTISSDGFATQVVSGFLRPGENYEGPPVTLLVTTAASEVRVTASQQEIATEQVREEEEQRVLGIIPNFYVSYAPDAPALTSRQKFHLAWKSLIDPITFLGTGFSAGLEQANNSYSGYGQGADGYAKRFGAGYADNFIGTMIGAAILPSLLKQDPRYFYKGTGTTRSRLLYVLASAVVCKGDNGRWQPNYSGISASLATGGISNLYYPAANRNGASLTFENAAMGIGQSAIQNFFQEFVIRKLTPRLPNYGSSKP